MRHSHVGTGETQRFEARQEALEVLRLDRLPGILTFQAVFLQPMTVDHGREGVTGWPAYDASAFH